MLLAGLLAVISLFLRFLRARGDEREQIRWFASASASALTFTWILLFEQLLGPRGGVFEVIVAASILVVVPSIPVATGIAILRYRLYDISTT
jgi:tryptophan-rich sensory protein